MPAGRGELVVVVGTDGGFGAAGAAVVVVVDEVVDVVEEVVDVVEEVVEVVEVEDVVDAFVVSVVVSAHATAKGVAMTASTTVNINAWSETRAPCLPRSRREASLSTVTLPMIPLMLRDTPSACSVHWFQGRPVSPLAHARHLTR